MCPHRCSRATQGVAYRRRGRPACPAAPAARAPSRGPAPCVGGSGQQVLRYHPAGGPSCDPRTEKKGRASLIVSGPPPRAPRRGYARSRPPTPAGCSRQRARVQRAGRRRRRRRRAREPSRSQMRRGVAWAGRGCRRTRPSSQKIVIIIGWQRRRRAQRCAGGREAGAESHAVVRRPRVCVVAQRASLQRDPSRGVRRR